VSEAWVPLEDARCQTLGNLREYENEKPYVVRFFH
jgi:hypothetical protein